MKAQLKPHNGTPTVFIDDQPAFFGCHLVGYMHPDHLLDNQPYARKYAEAGVHIYSVDNFTHEWVGPRPDNPSPYDFSLVVPRHAELYRCGPAGHVPDAHGGRNQLDPSTWFNKAYPDEVEVRSDGTSCVQLLRLDRLAAAGERADYGLYGPPARERHV